MPGQMIHLGNVELFVENTDVKVAIPEYERSMRSKPPVMLGDGKLACGRHPDQHATYQCTHCHEVMCNHCLVIMRVKGDQPLFICPLCSHKCAPIGGPTATKTQKKKGVLSFLQDTVKLKFKHPFGSNRP